MAEEGAARGGGRRSCARKKELEGGTNGRRRNKKKRKWKKWVLVRLFFLLKIKPRIILSIHPNCWVHQQCFRVHLATPFTGSVIHWAAFGLAHVIDNYMTSLFLTIQKHQCLQNCSHYFAGSVVFN